MRATALLAVAMTLGCAHAPGRSSASRRLGDPTALLAAWSHAIAGELPADGRRLLSSALRAQENEHDFQLGWRAAAADLHLQAPWLARPWQLRSASVELPDGRALPLARDGDLWRVAAPRLLAPGGDTPADTLRRLLAAVAARDLDAIVGLFAEPLRSTIEQALAERVTHLQRALQDGAPASAGNPARIRYDSRYHIDLVQENGRWRIADFN